MLNVEQTHARHEDDYLTRQLEKTSEITKTMHVGDNF